MADHADPKLGPVEVVREQLKGVKGGSASQLWIKQPENQAEDRNLLAARLCSCDDVCLAVMEDNG